MSWVLTGRMHTCKGKRFCFLSEIMEHFNEISQNIKAREEKATAYEKMIAERKAREELEKHKANAEKLKNQLAKELAFIEKAEKEINGLGQITLSA